MSQNKKFIAFFSVMTACFLLLTYIFSIINFKCDYMNNNFLVVAFGGLFGSFGVTLLAEIKKYFVNKRDSEINLYSTFLALYSELVVEVKNAEYYLSEPIVIPGNLFSGRSSYIQSYANMLQTIDYSTFCENSFSISWKNYRDKEISALNNHVILCQSRLSLAINNEKLLMLEKGKMNYTPRSDDKYVNITLRKMIIDAKGRIGAIERIMDALDKTYPNKYKWNLQKDRINNITVGNPLENKEIKDFFEE